jgi:hypothetical protein
MEKIEKRVRSTGEISYRVKIRTKGNEISRTFYTEHDAKLFEFYIERLIKNKDNFDISIDQTITLLSIFEMKIKTINQTDKRTIHHFQNCIERFTEIFGDKILYSKISYDDWLNAAKKLSTMFVYRGGTKFGKKESAKRTMSSKTLRNIFAYAASAVSSCIELGIQIENHPQRIINSFIKDLMKSESPM